MPGAMRFLAFLSLVAADSWNEICNVAWRKSFLALFGRCGARVWGLHLGTVTA